MIFQEHDVVRHVRSGNEYEIVGTPRTYRLEATNEPAYAYRRADRAEDIWWVRSQALMEDGRFVFVRQQEGFEFQAKPSKPVRMEMENPLPCPFCGRKVDMEDPDTLYPSGSGWQDLPELECRTYVSARAVPPEQWCYGMHCPTQAGGCGAEIHGDSREEALANWNRRPGA